jgi:hypothetical protein
MITNHTPHKFALAVCACLMIEHVPGKIACNVSKGGHAVVG